MNKQKITSFIQWTLLVGIVISAFLLMLTASRQESATMDELAHIPSGYTYDRFLDYRLNPEHPPLVKAISGFPLLFLNLNYPTNADSWQKALNGQWDAGREFLYESGNDADKIVQWSRIGPMLLTILLILFIYIWSRQILGGWWGLIPAFLFGFSPTILAHGHLVTTDIGASLGAFISIYFFSKYLIAPSKKGLLLSGVALGLAQLLKFSSVLIFPLFIFLALAQIIWQGRSSWRNNSWIQRFGFYIKSLFVAVWRLILIFITCFAIIYAAYLLFTFKYPIERQVADTEQTLQSFAGGPDPTLQVCNFSAKLPLSRRMRCIAEVDILMAKSPVLRPFGQYFLGVLMVSQRASGGNTGYFMGEISNLGWPQYFPILFLTKETIPALIIFVLGFLAFIISLIKKFSWNPFKFIKRIWDSLVEYIGTSFAEFSMISFVVLYWAYSLKSPLNIGIRHILPTIPLIYILSLVAIKKMFPSDNYLNKSGFFQKIGGMFFGIVKKSGKAILVSGLIAWHFTESIATYPNYLSYYNEFAGGTDYGYQIATDSNYDWGQDLKRLKEFVEKNNIQKIGVDYFGGGNPKYYLSDKEIDWRSSLGDPTEHGIEWMAVSVNFIQQSQGKPVSGFTRNPEDSYSWLSDPYKPYAKAGKSIFIYKLK